MTTLADSIPADRVLVEPEELRRYARDWSSANAGLPAAVVLPATVEEVRAVVRWARKTGTALVPSGGRTGLSGGAMASDGEVVVSMERMNRILSVDVQGRTLVAQAGATTHSVQQCALEHGLFYPVDFASRGSSQIGGNVATNAGGIKVLRYGMTRNWVAGLRVVTGTGDVLDLNRGLSKNATGYDLRHLFVGSEGTLGIVVEATLQLAAIPPSQQVMVLAVPELHGVMDLLFLLRSRLSLSAFEFFTDVALGHVTQHGAKRPFERDTPYYVLLEFDADETAALKAFEECMSAGLVVDGVVSTSDRSAAELWRLREGITESLALHRPFKSDISVAPVRMPELLARGNNLFAREFPDLEVVWFGHVGDGNVHLSVLRPEGVAPEAFSHLCDQLGHKLGRLLADMEGSISAEHGIGLLKRPYLRYTRSDAEIALMRGLKSVFDPDGLMNPGKLL